MKIPNGHYGITFIVFLILLLGCKSPKEAEKTIIRKKSVQELLTKLNDNQFSFDWLSAKLSTKAVIANKKMEVSIKLRLRKDSAIWMSVSPALGIEIARVLISRDSIKYINRLDKTFYIGPYDFFKNHTPVDLNFNILQSILTGSSKEIIEKSKDDNYTQLKSSVNKGKHQLKKTQKRKDKKGKEDKMFSDDYGNKIWLDPSTFKLVKSELHAKKTNKKLVSNYENFMPVDEQMFPHKIIINIKGEESIAITFDFYKVIINKPLNMPYTIPEKYVRNEW